MNVLPINNVYNAYAAATRRNSTVPVSVVSFGSLFGKSLNDKFEDGIKALDGTSIFLFGEEKELNVLEHSLAQNAEKIDIPILKTYTYTTNEKELPEHEISINFGIFKKDNKYYIIDLNSFSGGLRAGSDIKDYKKNRFSGGEIRELKKDDKILIHHELFNESKNVIFNFVPPKVQDSSAAESYMKVKKRFDNKDSLKNFNKSSIEIISRPKDKTNGVKKEFTFDDIGGLDEQINELRKYVIRPVNYPEVYRNIRLNKGILLYGPPRCGKTLLGQALANEAKTRFAYINANEFVSSTVGSSEANVRNVFNELMQSPAILFIDEFDAVGKKRDGSSNARFQDTVVNQLLGCMSDLEKSYTNSFVIAATNRKDLLDDALTASGRFGLHLEVPMPDEAALGQIYDIHSKNQPLDNDVSKSAIVEMMLAEKFNGSDVAEMFTVGYMNAIERLGFDKKMDAKLFRFEDLNSLKVITKDLVDAIAKISAQKITAIK